MSRLDLLRKSGDAARKNETKAKSLIKPITNNFHEDDDFSDLGELFTEHKAVDTETNEYDNSLDDSNEDDTETNIIEIDMGDIGDTNLFYDDEDIPVEDNVEAEKVKDIEPEITKPAYEIKSKISIVLENKDFGLSNFLPMIKNGGFEARTEDVLIIDDIVEFSVQVPEFSEEKECFAKIVCVFPKEVRTMTGKAGNKYWLQFFDAEAKPVNDLISKYLMGYKGKKE